MPIILNTIRLLVGISIMMSLMAGCGENYIPLGQYRIEWDEHDPRLHGQIVRFKETMRYVLLDERHIGDYAKEEVEIGRILESEEAVFMPGGDAKLGYLSEPIKDGMAFTIKASYWYRCDWFNRQLNGDIRMAVLLDENGKESIVVSFSSFAFSDRPEFVKLRDEGRFK